MKVNEKKKFNLRDEKVRKFNLKKVKMEKELREELNYLRRALEPQTISIRYGR